MFDFTRWEDSQAVKTAADLALSKCFAMVARPFVSTDVIFSQPQFPQHTTDISLTSLPTSLLFVRNNRSNLCPAVVVRPLQFRLVPLHNRSVDTIEFFEISHLSQ